MGLIRDPRHLAFVRQLPCLACGVDYGIHAAHIRFDSGAGMGMKPGDNRVVPLCYLHHTEGPDAQHRSGEREWWRRRNINPISVAEHLYDRTGQLNYCRGYIIELSAHALASCFTGNGRC
ncbi:MAG: hypothetical protein AAF556_09580 [Pseudomonadota bacterium]